MFLPELVIFTLAFLFYLLAVLIHLLVIIKVIPFTLINGGRSESYETQSKQSYISIVILVIAVLFVFLGYLIPDFKRSVAFMVSSLILAGFWLLGTVMQLLGTKFERYYVSWINIIGFVSHLELALIYFSD